MLAARGVSVKDVARDRQGRRPCEPQVQLAEIRLANSADGFRAAWVDRARRRRMLSAQFRAAQVLDCESFAAPSRASKEDA